MNHSTLFHIFSNPPTLETERLTLRRMRVEDTEDMFAYASRADVTRYLLWSPHPNRAYTREFLVSVNERMRSGEYYDWALVERASGHMIGTCGYASVDERNNTAEIGYCLNPDYWGRGYMSEAVHTVLDFGFRHLELERIQARYMIGNERSRRVMEKNGMQYEGRNRNAVYVRGKYVTVDVYSILREEFFRKP